MPTSTNFALTLLEENQAQAEVLVNEAIEEFDDFLGREYAYSLKTDSYALVKTNRRVLMNASTSKTFTMPAVSGAGAPKSGQAFFVGDASGALITNGATLTIAVPSGAKLDGVTDGTAVIYGDKGWAWLVFVDASTGYVILNSKGLLDTKDLYVNITDWLGAPTAHTTNNITLPTAANHVPGYIPFRPPWDVGVDQVIFCFGSAGPSSDVSDANVRLGFYASDASTRLPTGAVLWATEDAKLQGSGHLRATTDQAFADIGSLATSLAPKTLSARRFFKGDRLYWLAFHLQPTFSAGTAPEITRTAMGPQCQKLSAGAQAWPYTMGSSPTVGVQFSGDTLSRLQFGLRFRRVN